MRQPPREAGLSLTIHKLKLKGVCHRHALSTIEYKQPAAFLQHINIEIGQRRAKQDEGPIAALKEC